MEKGIKQVLKKISLKQYLKYGGIAVIAIIVAVLAVRVTFKITQSRQKPKVTVYNVNVMKAKKTLLKETISAQSIIEGNPQVKVYPNNISGLFINNVVKEGDFVYKNAVIANIDRNIPGSDFLPATVTSPISGIVIKLYLLDKGATVTATTPIAVVANITSVKCEANFGVNDLLKIKKGQNVIITSDYMKDLNIQAKVDSVTPFIDTDSYSGNIDVYLNNSDRKLILGLSVNVDVEVDQRMAYVVPESTIIMGSDSTYIFINQNNKAKIVNVTTGYSNNGKVEITGDINDGDEIITDGNFKLSEGSLIKVFDGTENTSSNTNSSNNNTNLEKNKKSNNSSNKTK